MGRSSDVAARLLDTLAAHGGPAGICPRVPRLAKLLGVSVSTVQRHLRRMEELGLVERIPVYERDDDMEWKQRQAVGFVGDAPRRQTSNTYRLRDSATGPGVTPKPETAGHPPVSRGDSATPRKGDLSTPPVEGQGVAHDNGERDSDTGVDPAKVDAWPAYADDRYYVGPGRRAAPSSPRADAPADPWAQDGPGRLIPVMLHVPEVDRLDASPKASEVLDTLRAGLGDVEVIEIRPHPTYRNSYGRTVDLETATPAALHGAYVDLLYGNGKRKPKRKGEPEVKP